MGDRTGRPVRYDCFGRVDAEGLWGLLGGEGGRERGREQVVRLAMQQGEEWTRLLAPKASEENGHEVYDHTMVVDLKQLSLKRFRKWDKAYMGNFAKVMSDYTPEVLYKCFLVNAPKTMSAAWAVVEPFLDQ